MSKLENGLFLVVALVLVCLATAQNGKCILHNFGKLILRSFDNEEPVVMNLENIQTK